MDRNNLNNLITKSEIKIFQHCNHERVICFNLPDKCPICSLTLDSKSLRVPPFVLTSPFLKNGKLQSISLILQPSNCDYTNLVLNKSDIGDLHIGITNSLAEPFDFDHNGLKRSCKRWYDNPTIHIQLDHKSFNMKTIFNETKKWDDLLECFWSQRDQCWTAAKYDETKFNCFDLIINFLFLYGYFDIDTENETSMDSSILIENYFMKKFLKQKISNELIEPTVRKSLKYLCLLIKLSDEKYFREI